MEDNLFDADSFVKIRNGGFYLGDRPYYFAGTNFWYGAYLGSKGDRGDRKRLIRELDLLRESGITNLRVMACSESADFKMALTPAIQTAPAVFDETFFDGLDFLLFEMGKRAMKAVVFFGNFWQWSGGFSQYVSWVTGEPLYDPDLEGNDLGGLMDMSAQFYQLEECQRLFRVLIQKIVTRYNPYSDIAYNDDPTIMSWELANEPRLGDWSSGRANFHFFQTWVHETCKYIRSLDDKHLLVTGTEGTWGILEDEDLFKASHSSPYVDYLTFHLWPKNWKWFDIHNPDQTYSQAMEKAKRYIDQQVRIASELGHPTVLEEFGIERDNGDYHLNSSVRWRDRAFRELLDYIHGLAVNKLPIHGSNFWSWGGMGRASHDDFLWRNGDPFTGDPPQEPQGLNSVFDKDKSTLAILKEHSKKMAMIGQKADMKATQQATDLLDSPG